MVTSRLRWLAAPVPTSKSKTSTPRVAESMKYIRLPSGLHAMPFDWVAPGTIRSNDQSGSTR